MIGSAHAGQPPPARPPAWVWVATALSALAVINVGFAAGDPMLELSPTSYGRSPNGFGAVHDLLSELRAQPSSERTRARYAQLPVRRTLWLLAPDFLALPEEYERRELSGEAELATELEAWVARGGTALIFGTWESDWSRYGLALAPPAPLPDPHSSPHIALPSTLSRQLRAIEVAGLRWFDPHALGEFERVLGKPEQPFAVLKRIGKGRLIAIADVSPLRNEHLDAADHANLAVDLARAYGTPLFDERCHGLLAATSLLAALGAQRSWLLGLGLGLCVLLALWHLRSVPASTLLRLPGLDPGLTSFVDSLALLYSRKAPRDAAAVYRAYLHGVRFRLRQQLYGARGGSDEQLGQRLHRELAGEPALLASVQGHDHPRGERELQHSVRALERCVALLADRHAAPRR